jgi:hypothetical protein
MSLLLRKKKKKIERSTTTDKMQVSRVFLLAVTSYVQMSLAVGVESVDFNVTQALIDQGFNTSAIPALTTLTNKSSSFGCSIAVGDTIPFLTIRSIC